MNPSRARGKIGWGDYLSLMVIGSTALMALILRYGDHGLASEQLSLLTKVLGGGVFVFFLFAFVLSAIAVAIAARERPISYARLAFRSTGLAIALLMQPYFQPYIAPFDVFYADGLQTRAESHRLLGKSRAIAVQALGPPTYVVNLPDVGDVVTSDAIQLRYRHWWPIWFGSAELLLDIRDERVVKIVVR